MICKACQKEIEDNSHFCPYCGTTISVSANIETSNIPVPPEIINPPVNPNPKGKVGSPINPTLSGKIEPSADSESLNVPTPTRIVEQPVNILPPGKTDQSPINRSPQKKNKTFVSVLIIFTVLLLALGGVCAYFIVKGNESKELTEYYEEKIADYKDEAKDFKDQIQSLNLEVDGYQSQVSDLEIQVIDLQIQVDDYLSQANDNSTLLQEYQNQLDSLQTKIYDFSNYSIMIKVNSAYNGNYNWEILSYDLAADSIENLVFDYKIFSVDDISNHRGNEISINIFGPDSMLLQGSSSPSSSTTVQTIDGDTNIVGWGADYSGSFVPGIYVIQFVYDGVVVGLDAIYLY